MTPNQFYLSVSRERLRSLCKEARTSVGNFQQIALAGGSVSARLAERLAKASGGEMTEMEILYPERYEAANQEGSHSDVA